MGKADPMSFSRGKRGIAGSLVFAVFDRDCFHTLKENQKIQLPYMNRSRLSMDQWNNFMQQRVGAGPGAQDDFYRRNVSAEYADEIPPFDVTINFN